MNPSQQKIQDEVVRLLDARYEALKARKLVVLRLFRYRVILKKIRLAQGMAN